MLRPNFESILTAAIATAVVASGCSDDTQTRQPEPLSADVIAQKIEASDRYIVKFKPGAAAAGRAAVAANGTIALDINGIDAVAAHLPDASVLALQNNPNIELIEKDPIRVPLATGAGETVPYGISMVQADVVSDQLTANRTVCIIDSGYDALHEDLPSGANITGNDSAAGPWNKDGCGHGSHVAGTIAALGANGQGVVGVNPGGTLNIHVERVFGDSCGWAYASELIDAAFDCRDAGANVISMSLGCASGGPWCYSSTEDAGFQQLYSEGLLSVAAASNDGKAWYSYPASYPSVVSIAAVDENEQHARVSNANDAVELAAPGVRVLSTVPENGYEAWSGTSMATPHVAAVAALVWSYDTTLTNDQIRSALRASAKDLDAAGYDTKTGFGLVQAQAALDHLGLAGGCATVADCDDGNPCTADSCTDGACANTSLADGTSCGSAGELCCSGVCAAPACDDDLDCTDAPDCRVGTCVGAGTCGATCDYQTSVPDGSTCGTDGSGTCCGGACDYHCQYDSDCEDGLTCTANTCEAIPGVCGMQCVETIIDSCTEPSVCGDELCEGDETYETCPADCPAPTTCGDGTCEGDETETSCPDDCAPATVCGDGVCEAGESGSTCPGDCRCAGKNCSNGDCGNGVCEKSENANNCALDCS